MKRLCPACLEAVPSRMEQVYEDEKTCPTCGAKNPYYELWIEEEEALMEANREHK